ncbi:MAG: ABC transporter permease subunit [Planctomicrobium sp.]|nr:ABC transporter permease subunit [Planctomicrobium sp.]
MIRGTLTLLNRSIRGDALKSQSHVVRLISIVILLLFLLAAHVRSSDYSAPGLEFFRSIAYLGIALISLAGIGHFSNSITEEKEEGTLGLLLLANISPLAILLGKSTNRVLSTILIFVAQFPFALLAITLGGITISQIFATYVALAGFLFLIANLSLLASVISRKSSEASAIVLLLIFLVLGASPAIANTVSQLVNLQFLSKSGNVVHVVDRMEALHYRVSVTKQISRIFEPNGSYHIFSQQLIFSMIIGFILFSLAWIRFSKIVWSPHQLEPHRVTHSSEKKRWSILISRPWKLAKGWKDFYFLAGGPTLILLKLIFLPLWIYLCFDYTNELRRFAEVDGGQFARDSLLIILVVEVLLFASQFYHTERKLGTLPTLLMLPQSVGQISYSKLLGCVIAIIPTVIALLITEYFVKRIGHGELVVYSQKMVLGISLLIIMSHLTVLCSLIAKWGALPMAVGLTLIVGMVVTPFVAGAMNLIASADQGSLAEISPVLYATGIFMAGTQLEIARRLKLIAGT